jgi:hypothetical protein
MFDVVCKVKCGCLVVNLLSHPFFRLASNVFSTTLHTKLNLSHPLVFRCHITFVTSLCTLWGSTFFTTFMVGRRRPHMMLYEMFLWPVQKMQDFTSCKNKPMPFCPLPCNFHSIKLTLCYQSMVFACWQMLSLPTSLKLNWFHKQCFPWGCYDSHASSKEQFLSKSVSNGHVFPSNYKSFHVFTPISK